MKNSIYYILIFFLPLATVGQPVLTLDEAVAKALDNNLNIKVFRNTVVAAENNATAGNAGMLPTVSLNASTNYSNNNTSIEFAGNIAPVERNGAQSNNNAVSVALNYTLFDGLAMFHNLDILKANKTQAEVNARLNIENIIVQVINGYYQVALLQNQLKIAKQALNISKERYQRAKTYNEFGGSSKVEFLSAEVDLNADSTAFLNAELNWINAKRNLNFLMGVENDFDFSAQENVSLNKSLQLPELFNKAQQNNAAILNAQFNVVIAEKQYQTTKSTLLPRITANASYGYNKQQNEVGILLSNQNTGLNAGLNLTYPIFNGGQQSTQRQNAQIQLENAQLQQQLAENQLVRDLNNAFSNYQNAIQVVELNEKNVVTAKLNFNRTKDLFELGQVTNTQFREAQLNYARSQSTLVNSSYTAKLAEAELVRISGELLVK